MPIGTILKEIGFFTVIKWNMTKKPIFILDEKIKIDYNLKGSRFYNLGTKLLSAEMNCELPFPGIGKLKIKNKMFTMNFYEEFLERQNKNFNKRKNNQFENRKRPCSSMSNIITRPASSLSTYRPGTGYVGVLPNLNLSVSSDEQIIRTRPNSRLGLQTHDEKCTNGHDRGISNLN
ncbi:coiled-coil domain-containing protein 81-like isoform X2 [Aphis craccivora]|uniref:Coiled-coil domain-containing protein 81-like isoform X2 n=1 Tax=Aphis craccivora TaxID=307492 RepID=A0A6G0VZI9_APHCR|nr:coiled-coil domain-containing protein 81-like isoform X2 [Aphis craccivora]